MTGETPEDGTARDAREEMDYSYADSQFHDDGIATSIPAQLRFTGDVDQDTARFHDALEERGYAALDHDPDRSAGGRRGSGDTPYYDGELCSREHYNRMNIWVGRSVTVRIYPHDEYVPNADELAEVIEAIEIGFGSELRHDPIERDHDRNGDTDNQDQEEYADR